jgi:hypothetical protein
VESTRRRRGLRARNREIALSNCRVHYAPLPNVRNLLGYRLSPFVVNPGDFGFVQWRYNRDGTGDSAHQKRHRAHDESLPIPTAGRRFAAIVKAASTITDELPSTSS